MSEDDEFEDEFNDRALCAIEAFESDAPGWQDKWSDLFEGYSQLMLFKTAEDVSRPGGKRLAMAHAMMMVSAMFGDAQLGVVSPLAQTASRNGRPPSDTGARARRFSIACAVAGAMALHRREGWTPEKCYRLVATDVSRESQIVLRWNEVRSIWTNRNRFGLNQLRSLDAIGSRMLSVRTSVGDESGISAEAYYRSLCGRAARVLSSKLPIF